MLLMKGKEGWLPSSNLREWRIAKHFSHQNTELNKAKTVKSKQRQNVAEMKLKLIFSRSK